MAKDRPALHAFNRGEVSKQARARVDVDKLRLAAETQENMVPHVLGPMSLRPGLAYKGAIKDHAAARILPFVFSNDDTAILELTNASLRVWNLVSGTETLVTRPSVSTAVTSGTFSASTGWTLTSSGQGSSTTVSGGQLRMAMPTSGGVSRASQTLTVAGGDQNVEHALRIVVTRGPVIFRAGSTSGGDEYITETTLKTGTHSLGFTPTGASVFIQFETRTEPLKLVDSCEIESSGTMVLPAPWTASQLSLVRTAQSGDIVYCACYGVEPRMIERRSTRSWSVVKYQPDDGPFQTANIADVTLTPADLSGNTTLTASRNYFRSTHVGCLFRLFSSGQYVEQSLSAANTFTRPIRVSGARSMREFTIVRSGTWTGTLRVQRSLEGPDSGFQDVQVSTLIFASPGNGSITYADDFDNTVIWYRVGFKSDTYGSGTAAITLTHTGGGGAGVCRVTAYSSRTSVSVEVLSPFSSLTATTNWSEGDWSDLEGWPAAVGFHDGRLWWAGRDKIWGSVSDDYYSHDVDFDGDAGPINRSVGFGPVDSINWLLPLTRLIVGREGAETSIRASSLDEPLTPTNFSLKDCSTQGSAAVQAARIDSRGVFVQQSTRRAYELLFDPESLDYRARDLTRLNLSIGEDGFEEIAVQRQPDTLIHFIRGDGQVASLVYERDDQVEAWWRIVTDGEIESCCVLPGTLEDGVYFVVNRTIGGLTKRYLEKMARRDQCLGQPEARLADSHIIYNGSAVTTITGLSHLEGETVTVWGWNTSSPFTATLPDGSSQTVGKDLGTFTVSGGQITGLGSSVTDACVGLVYTGKFKSVKLAYAAARGTALGQTKRVDQVGLVVFDTHAEGLEYGGDFDTMDSLPDVEEGADTSDNVIWDDRELPMTTLPGSWETDARLCLRATAPRPCTVAAAIIQVTTNE